jgi:hypothetical protein
VSWEKGSKKIGPAKVFFIGNDGDPGTFLDGQIDPGAAAPIAFFHGQNHGWIQPIDAQEGQM